MAEQPIPSGPQDLTPEWLTQALRSGGAIERAAVSSFEVKVIGEGAGFLGQLAQVRLTYDRPEEGAPQSLIAKLPAAAPENKEVAQFFRFYEREVRFYDEIAHSVELRTPRLYFSHFDAGTGDFALLIEDLAPACVGDQLSGCTTHQVELAVRELARFHAAWWEHPKLQDLDWLPSIHDQWYVEAVAGGYAQAWGPFNDYFGDRLAPAMRDLGERYGQKIPQLMEYFGTAPCTIIHGDYRLDNLFFDPSQPGSALAVIDWQISARARGVFDVAYFLAGTLPPDQRRAGERDLVRLYHDLLAEGGVRGYSLELCWDDYRRSLLFLLNYAVIGIGSLDLANERGVELFEMIAQRTMTAIDDLNAGELLPE
jgi:aminoglycoside/choline kinase family phosphotransferase